MAPPSGNIDNDVENYEDEAPTFIDMNDAVEVKVPDGNIANDDDDDMMDDDDDDNDAAQQQQFAAKLNNTNNNNNNSASGSASASSSKVPIVDQSKATFTSHTDAIYAISSYYNPTTHTLSILSGGGDDRAYLHQVTTTSSSSSGVQQQHTNTISLSHPHTDSISCVAFNTPYITNDVGGKLQKNLVAVGSYDGSIVLYNADDNDTTTNTQQQQGIGKLVQVLEGPSDVEFLTFHPKGGTVLLAGSIADGTIWMYHTPSNTCLQVFVGHEGGVTSGTFTPDGKWVVSAGQDGTCRVWAPKTGMSKHVFRLMEHGGGEGPGAGLTCLAVGGGSDGQLALCGGEDGNGYVVHISGKKLVATLPHFEETPGNNSNNNNTAANANNEMGDDDEDMEGEARSIEAVGFCPGNIPGTAHWCATGGVDGILKIWNMNVTGTSAQLRQRCVRPSDDQSQPAGITKLTWHNSLPLVICAYTDGVVCVWDVRVGTLVTTLTGHEDMITDMCVNFVNGGGTGGSSVAVIVTGSDDKMVKMFEYQA